jgi:exodeoxyribonuclease III
MRIITWNCNMAFRKKAKYILSREPDIVIVPECEHPSKLLFEADITKPTDSLWFGRNQHKGLGIFSFSKCRFRVLESHNPKLRTIIPIAVSGMQYDILLFAIWAYNPQDSDGTYIEQVWKAIHHYGNLLLDGHTILVGDFNSNSIWDKKNRESNHSNVTKHLGERGIFSAYHIFHKQIQGKEDHPTFYLYRHRNKPYHIDYCFASSDLTKKIVSVEVGDFEYWIQHSDHVPLIVEFDLS